MENKIEDFVHSENKGFWVLFSSINKTGLSTVQG
uniref:Uncharacterized protein n=1 Tax=Anguilla anguilla TaxID=7936 RepID=A0A0E9RI97_ANGAN